MFSICFKSTVSRRYLRDDVRIDLHRLKRSADYNFLTRILNRPRFTSDRSGYTYTNLMWTIYAYRFDSHRCSMHREFALRVIIFFENFLSTKSRQRVSYT